MFDASHINYFFYVLVVSYGINIVYHLFSSLYRYHNKHAIEDTDNICYLQMACCSPTKKTGQPPQVYTVSSNAASNYAFCISVRRFRFMQHLDN